MAAGGPMVLVILALGPWAGADYIYNGTGGTLITGEDGGAYSLSYINKATFFDSTANAGWVVLRGSTVTVGGKDYIYDNNGKTVFDDGQECATHNLNANSVLLNSSRTVLALTVMNDCTTARAFNVWVEDINLTAPYSAADRPLHYYLSTADGIGLFGKLATKATGTLASGQAAVMSWDLMDGSSWTTLPTRKGLGNSGETPQVGDWLSSLAPRVQVGTSNADRTLITDVTLTAVPEPGTMLLLGSGLVGVLGWHRRRKMR
jgi:hypothetical protein